jgi:hypothetical protein
VNQTNLNRVILPAVSSASSDDLGLTSDDVRLTSGLTWQLNRLVSFVIGLETVGICFVFCRRVSPILCSVVAFRPKRRRVSPIESPSTSQEPTTSCNGMFGGHQHVQISLKQSIQELTSSNVTHCWHTWVWLFHQMTLTRSVTFLVYWLIWTTMRTTTTKQTEHDHRRPVEAFVDLLMLRDFRLARVMSKDESIEQFATSVHRHPILWGEIWCHCFTSLEVNATPVHNEEAKLFTSTYGA